MKIKKFIVVFNIIFFAILSAGADTINGVHRVIQGGNVSKLTLMQDVYGFKMGFDGTNSYIQKQAYNSYLGAPMWEAPVYGSGQASALAYNIPIGPRPYSNSPNGPTQAIRFKMISHNVFSPGRHPGLHVPMFLRTKSYGGELAGGPVNSGPFQVEGKGVFLNKGDVWNSGCSTTHDGMPQLFWETRVSNNSYNINSTKAIIGVKCANTNYFKDGMVYEITLHANDNAIAYYITENGVDWGSAWIPDKGNYDMGPEFVSALQTMESSDSPMWLANYNRMNIDNLEFALAFIFLGSSESYDIYIFDIQKVYQ